LIRKHGQAVQLAGTCAGPYKWDENLQNRPTQPTEGHNQTSTGKK